MDVAQQVYEIVAKRERYYRTVFTWEVLSTEPIRTDDPEVIMNETRDGDWSGVLTHKDSYEVSKVEMAELLIAQGSDPEFLIASDADDPA